MSQGASDASYFDASLRPHAKLLKRIYLTVPWPKRLKRWLCTTAWGYALDCASATLSILTVVVYILETYVSLGRLPSVVEDCCGTFFAAEYGLRLYSAEYRWRFFFSWESGVDLLTILPPFLEISLGRSAAVDFAFLRFARLLRLLRILRIHRIMKRTDSLIQRRIAVLCFSMLTLVVWSAGAFIEAERDQLQYFHDGLYWAAVTIATVGYGDIYPHTPAGKCVVVLTILLVAVVLPLQMNEIVTLLAQRSYYERASYSAYATGRHIVMAGSINAVAFADFVEEFYHPDHGFEDRDIVILSPAPPERELEVVARSHDRISFIQGSAMSHKDLRRTSVRDATAVFILCDKHSQEPDREDETNLLIALAIAQYLRGETFAEAQQVPRILIEILSPESRTHLASFVDGPCRRLADVCRPHFSVLCILETKLAMIAQSAVGCPGLITLVCNLCRSLNAGVDAQGPVWRREYLRGAAMEIYRTPLSPHFMHKRFGEVAALVYAKLGAILIGVETSSADAATLRTGSFTKVTAPDNVTFRQLILADTDYVITDVSRTVGFVIAPNLETCLEIAAYDIPLFAAAPGRRFASFRRLDRGVASLRLQKLTTQQWEATLVEQLEQSSRPLPIHEGVEEATPNTRRSQRRWTEYFHPRRRTLSLDSTRRAQRPWTVPSTPATESRSSKFPFSFPGNDALDRFARADDDATSPRARRHWQEIKVANETGLLRPKTEAQSMLLTSVQRAVYLRQHYHVYRSPWSLEEATICEVEFKGHVVIFGISGVLSLFHLVAPFRVRQLRKLMPIVLVDQQPLPPSKWNEISMFQAVYFFQGSAKSSADLRRLRIGAAAKAVILPNRARPQTVDVYHEARLDADVVLTYNQLTALNSNLEIFMNVNAAANLAFLMPGAEQGRNRTAHFITSPFFAAGMVFLSGIMDTLFCQAFFNSDILRIFRKILVEHEGSAEEATRPVQLRTVGVGSAFVARRFGELFAHELSHGRLALGLFRKGLGKRGNAMPYVYTNPPADLVLEAEDAVYILSADVSSAEMALLSERTNKLNWQDGGCSLLDKESQPSRGAPTVDRMPHDWPYDREELERVKDEILELKRQLSKQTD